MKQPKSGSDMRDFPGLVLQSDAHDLPEGAGQDQVNIKSDEIGRLTVRLGVRQLSFEE